jgi:hypothetical protein
VSDSRRPDGGLKAQYDKLALTVTLVLLLGSAGLLAMMVRAARQDLRDPVWERVGRSAKPTDPVNLATREESFKRFHEPAQIAAADRNILVSPLRVTCTNTACMKPIAYSALVCPFCKAVYAKEDTDLDRDGDGIPDKVEIAVGMSPIDPTDAAGDKDGDTYSNMDEYVFDRTGSSITNAAAQPMSCSKLRLARRAVYEPFKLLFKGVSKLDKGEWFQLSVRDTTQNKFAKIGETVAGFKVVEYREKDAAGPTLDLEKDGKRYSLTRGKVQDIEGIGEWKCTLYSLADNKPYPNISIGAAVQVRGDVYKVVDIKEESVVVRGEKTGSECTVPKISEKELQILRGGAAAPGVTPGAPAAPGAPATPSPAAGAAAPGGLPSLEIVPSQ